jgi:hypothetical protein
MSSAPTIPAISGAVTVNVPVERAFRVFTESFDLDARAVVASAPKSRE